MFLILEKCILISEENVLKRCSRNAILTELFTIFGVKFLVFWVEMNGTTRWRTYTLELVFSNTYQSTITVPWV